MLSSSPPAKVVVHSATLITSDATSILDFMDLGLLSLGTNE
jgi:hypothetical protein